MTNWIRFTHGGAEGFGVLDDGAVEPYEGDMFNDPRPTGGRLGVDDVKLKTPVSPSKMIALANNFHALIDRLGLQQPEEPLYFLKANSAFHPTGEPIRRPRGYDGKIIFEGELGIVIGRTCRNVPVAQARDVIFGYTCVNDVTAIDLLNKDPSFQQWTRSKAADTFGIFGPSVATDIDPRTARVRTLVDGGERQNYPVSDMVFDPMELVSRISWDMTLLPGDVIACGTSVGVGSLKPGNTVSVSIEGIGTLRNEFIE